MMALRLIGAMFLIFLVAVSVTQEQRLKDLPARVAQLEEKWQRLQSRRQITSGTNSPAIASSGDVTLTYGEKQTPVKKEVGQ